MCWCYCLYFFTLLFLFKALLDPTVLQADPASHFPSSCPSLWSHCPSFINYHTATAMRPCRCWKGSYGAWSDVVKFTTTVLYWGMRLYSTHYYMISFGTCTFPSQSTCLNVIYNWHCGCWCEHSINAVLTSSDSVASTMMNEAHNKNT